MDQAHGKLSLGFFILMAVVLFWGTMATAGVVIEEYNAKLKGLRGAITKIEGNKITLRDQAGKFYIIRVRPEATDKDHKLVGFQMGDKVIIEGGRMNKVSGDPVPIAATKVKGACSKSSLGIITSSFIAMLLLSGHIRGGKNG